MTEEITAKAKMVYDDLLAKKREIEERKSTRFAEFLRKRGSDEDEEEDWENLKGEEAEDEAALSEAAQITAAVIFDMLQKIADSQVPDLRAEE